MRRYIEEAVSNGNLAVLDTVLSPDYYNPTTAAGPTPGVIERYKQSVAQTRASFPDLRVTFESMVADGDLVAYHTVWRGTHLGEWRGIPPTGKRVEWRVTAFRRVVEGKVVAGWGTYDWLAVYEQLGATVSPPAQT